MTLTSRRLGEPKRHVIVYEVEGRGRFPLDMLRYDASFPAGPEDVSAIEDFELVHGAFVPISRQETRRVRLVHYADHTLWEPTEGRWNSFGWWIVH